MINIYDTANQLEREIRQLPEYSAVQEAFTNVQNNEEAKGIYSAYTAVQNEMHQKMMSGAMPTPEDQAKLQEVGQKVEANEIIRELLTAEQKFSGLVQEINTIIMKPIQEIYEGRK
ncbi:MAG: YlbF family regulator [Streptococcaceae bacterium]|jgi:cell fate (sporulation/competence/biofilm development) regulator YlbF (YheA/YmcA/DUF963 family)|nr:YlbF family regulator [Streptococcaceae bacterium]